MDLSLIVPAYKSKQILADQLPVLLHWTANWQYKTEVIVVVDGDDVSSYQQALKHLPVTVTGYERNRGKGYAVKYGFKQAQAPVVIFTDADIPFAEKDMLKMADLLTRHKEEKLWIIGDRTLPGSVYYEHISQTRKAGSDLFLFIIKHTLGKNFADTQCGLKGFTALAGEAVFEKSKVNRFAFDFECLYIARHLNFTVHKIPVTLRNQSPSTVNVYRDGLKLLKDVFKVLFVYKYE